MIDPKFLAYLEGPEYQYFNVKEIEGRGICGLLRMVFTVGLVYGIDEVGYTGRYCYPTRIDAIDAINKWDGKEDPPGDWIKHKGYREYRNPNNVKNQVYEG